MFSVGSSPVSQTECLLGESIHNRPSPVTSKRDFVRRYALGEFGNASPTWTNISDFREHLYSLNESSPTRLTGELRFSLRSSVPSDKTQYDLPYWTCLDNWANLLISGAKGWYASEMAPTPRTVIQGEVCRTVDGLCFFYSTGLYTMKEGLRKNGQQAVGVFAKSLLEYYLPVRDYEWLMYLLDEAYPDHVVEFTTYSCCWGTVPGFKTVYWEVRHGY